MDMVCKFNSNVTLYNDRNASSKIALSVRMEALVFVTRAIMCRRLCFMTLTLPRIASRIMGGSLFLVNKREPSSHGFELQILRYCLYGQEDCHGFLLLFALKSNAWSILSKMASSESLSSTLSLMLLLSLLLPRRSSDDE